MSAVERDPAAQATLWRQRVFEVHAAMSAYLAERHRREDLGDWVATSARIFADLPTTDDLRAEAWQAVFFRAQALIEQFIVARPADYRLDDWARATARIYRALEPAGRSDPASAADRLARQAALYGSRFEVQAEADGRAVFHNRHCAIWDYRERARARGVPITLESACTYCTKLLSAFVAASDCRADWRLYEEPQGHGCVWTITADSLNQGAGVHERDH
ncbi:TPA: hypothetical protein ACID7F_000812 [Pseudomonas aeruginosa]|nr:hypothetical protein [Pseudomonas aeruginosa]EKU4051069.1 hypothetical protein [Pseudomonas aeruginosa]EKX7956126.1 hypothetical protein [Pseudomonas aeruginosa]EKX9337680.1 hypothetical protein [Pseudomonas aeruginosa]